MTPQERLGKLQAVYEKANNIIDGLNKFGGIAIDGLLVDTIDEALGIASKATAELIGLEYGVLEWFIYENDWGRKGLAVSVEYGPEVVIDSIEAFLKFEMPS